MYSPEFIGWYFVAEGNQISYPCRDVWDSTYLSFAQIDFTESDTQRHYVNAVSNAKRALHYQVDALAEAFGFQKFGGVNNFPSKLDFLGRCGVSAHSIIRRINKFRNSVEHDYHFPTKDEAEEYLDIVDLYIQATRKIAQNFPEKAYAELMSDDEEYDEDLAYPENIDIYFPEGEGKLKIVGEGKTIVDISIIDEDYFDWVSALVCQCVA